ncbi:glycosyltransferase family 1 protein [Pisolithus microcarpus 441]|uniref:UDP-N-acetylglucosamine transferase subunit ALG14 n=1 Tax=Pisolithus microcarpus 441 TaxID=765257 RepID=A0A0D0A6S5_9AGAM|nr:glycosyltransferase family 1 protein [Pisolithus microcarpus]KIK27768.1 glycosyltransferase family 1 protein [Pisolithus microcarpus 441]
MAWGRLIVGTGFCLLLSRIFLVIYRLSRRSERPSRQDADICSLAVFLGSGGHTAEASILLSALDFSRYCPRTYIVSEGDELSNRRAVALENLQSARNIPLAGRFNYKLMRIPRARHVHQSPLSASFTTFKCFLACVHLVTVAPLFQNATLRKPFVDLLIMNGPGTCVPLCAAIILNRIIGLPTPRMVFVESFARVQSISHSGRILLHMVDRFIVQWPEQIALTGGRGEYHGWLV